MLRDPAQTTAAPGAQDRTPDIIDQPTGGDLAALGHAPMPVLAAIRSKCLDCSCGVRAEVADCLVRSCFLWPFRLGTNPWRTPVSEARREAARRSAARLQKAGTIPAFGETAAGPIGQAVPAAAVRKPVNGTGSGATERVAGAPAAQGVEGRP